MSNPVQIAQAHWGVSLPDWVLQLAHECESASQNKVAAKLGISASAISQVLRAKYGADLANIETSVRGVFMNEVTACPALGNIPAHVCLAWRRKAKQFSNSNLQRVRMYRACRKCSKFTGE